MSNEEKIQEIAATMRSEKLVRSRVFPFFSKEKLPYQIFSGRATAPYRST